MKILVVGGSHGTGALAVRTALSRGHEVTVLARSPDKLDLVDAKLHKLAGSFFEKADLERAVPSHQAVIVTASVSRLGVFKEEPHYFSKGTRLVIDVMKAHGVKRLAILSALGTGDSRSLMPWLLKKLTVDWLLKVPFEDHDRQEAMVRSSGLEWIIARPGRLTNGPGRGRYETRTELAPVPSAISRADLADFLVKACEEDRWVGHAVQLGG